MLTHWLQPSETDAELLTSKYIQVTGKQFLAPNTLVKVSDWQHERYWGEGNFTTIFPEWSKKEILIHFTFLLHLCFG